MKISIRTSILDLFLVLTLMIGTVIIGINYRLLDNLLNISAQKLLTITGLHVKDKVLYHFGDMGSSLKIGANLISNGNITPAPSLRFSQFLLGFLMNNPSLFAAYWGDPQGNYYGVEKDSQNTFFYETIIRSPRGVQEHYYHLDPQGKIIEQAANINVSYDPRLRPWYQATEKNRRLTWSDIYLFKGIIKNPKGELGITAAMPIYANDGSLKGFFAVDQTLGELSTFISKLQTTEHGIIFISDEKGHLLAAKKFAQTGDIVTPITRLHTVDSLGMPWLQASFSEFKHQHRQYFSFEYQHERYLAYYETISNIGHKDLYVSIVVPLSDVTQPIREQTIHSILATIIVLMMGLIIASFFATRISRPIIKLADEAESIKHFESFKITAIHSIIREVIYLQNALNSLKNGLRSFERYIPISLVRKLITTGEVAHVGGKNSEVTILFSDIKNFTSISEEMPPQKLMAYLSEYFDVMSKIIAEQKGTIDKYIGDEIMAFWGAPIDDGMHLIHACQSALMMLEALKQLNQAWQVTEKPPMTIRMGIHTGSAIVGNVGSAEHLGYTVLGDNVNIASRLEELNKLYHTTVMVSEMVFHVLKDQFSFRLVDQVAVRGRQQSIVVYELLPEQNIFGDKLALYNSEFRIAFNEYQKGGWASALSLFETLAQSYPQDPLILLFIKRCQNFTVNPPQQWQGVWIIKE